MNIEAYNLDTLRKLVRNLQKENRELRALLQRANVPCAQSEAFLDTPEKAEDYDPDQGARILRQPVSLDMAKRFYSMFWGREDVFAKRARNGNYYPQCGNRWNSLCPRQAGDSETGKRVSCADCPHTSWIRLKPETVLSHLNGYREDGTDVIGVYPLLPDGEPMCGFSSEGPWMLPRQEISAFCFWIRGFPP